MIETTVSELIDDPGAFADAIREERIFIDQECTRRVESININTGPIDRNFVTPIDYMKQDVSIEGIIGAVGIGLHSKLYIASVR